MENWKLVGHIDIDANHNGKDVWFPTHFVEGSAKMLYGKHLFPFCHAKICSTLVVLLLAGENFWFGQTQKEKTVK